jgi:hypothetical protein
MIKRTLPRLIDPSMGVKLGVRLSNQHVCGRYVRLRPGRTASSIIAVKSHLHSTPLHNGPFATSFCRNQGRLSADVPLPVQRHGMFK